MHILLLFVLGLLSVSVMGLACSTPWDILKTRSEFLGEELYHRASWKDVWLNLVPRGSYEKGAGYTKSSFEIGRSEPATDEESWPAIAPVSAENLNGACNITYNQTYTGFHQDDYKPEAFGLMGPDICQDDLTMQWQAEEFWERYFQALDKRNRKSVINRLGNVYRQYSYKASANQDFHFIAGNVGTQPAPAAVDLSGLDLPQSELTQEMLNGTAIELMEEGADEPNSNGWITQGNHGAEFPLYIGSWMSDRLVLNNSEFRADINHSFSGWKDANPTLRRLGSSLVLKNFRHVINRFPARWAYVPANTTINFTSRGMTATSGVLSTFTQGATSGYKRIPTFVQSTNSLDATKGQVAKVNGVWRDPSVATYESVEVLNPMVMKEEVLMPVTSIPGLNLKPQNYFGEWKFVTGNDAFLGIEGCTGITDPLHKRGRHFAEYRHALKPILGGVFGRMILFKRCVNAFDVVACS